MIDMKGLAIKPSPIHRFGLFADRDFAPNEVILKFDNDATAMLNHSCVPTCYTREIYPDTDRDDLLMAGKDGVKKGEEITVDYRGTRYEKVYKELYAPWCNCPKCRYEKETQPTA